MKLSQQQIEQIGNYFADKPVLKAYVFGSFARGDADEKSDIDLIVELAPNHGLGLEYVGMVLDLQDMFNRKVDMLSSNFLPPRLVPYINNNRQLIYQK